MTYPCAHLTQTKAPSARIAFVGTKAPFIYRCPNAGLRIQALAAEEITEGEEAYEAVTCIRRQQVHLVNPHTGKVLGEDTE